MTRSCAAVTLALMFSVAACGGDDEAPSTRAAATAEAPVDDVAVAVEDRWQSYWHARIAAENSGRLDRRSFTAVASGKALEAQTRRMRNYRRNALVRVGEPEFRDVEVRRTDDSAMVLACFNADAWTATIDGEPWSAQKYGWELTGSVMKQVEGAWLVADEMATEDIADMGKTC